MGKGSLLRKMLSFEFAIEDVAPPRKSCSRSKKKKHRIPAESSASKQTTANSPSSTLPSLIRPTTGPSEGTLPSSKDEPLCLMPAENPPLQDQEAVIHPAFRVNNCLSDVNDCLSDIAQPEMEEQVSEDPEGLCRFCDERLPHPQSARLAALGTSLVRRREVARRYSRVNPLALHLPFPVTADYCRLHQTEIQIIPMGIKQGWPTQIDFSKLSKSVPATSIDHPAQKHTNHLSDRRVEKLADHLWALVYMFLKSTLETVTRLAHPLDPEYLLRKGLMPEAALCLIGLDMSLPMSHPKVRATLEQSREFGNAMYPDE
ncbi:hypothetical protein H4Q26_014801 [Puccinia striiformis f. sp. tritici PST-130]|nr:hypothetical protein H4Q26_014801 [Puccinia striiformis f. sp. tritici PST-130]